VGKSQKSIVFQTRDKILQRIAGLSDDFERKKRISNRPKVPKSCNDFEKFQHVFDTLDSSNTGVREAREKKNVEQGIQAFEKLFDKANNHRTVLTPRRQWWLKQPVIKLQKYLPPGGLRTINILEGQEVLTIRDLLMKTRREVLNMSCFGKETLAHIYEALAQIGFVRYNK
jgi:DNA-directed RNA polymerase alpha subunit